MSKNVVTPKSVSFEDALRNLASRLTGRPAAELPRTQEGIVQFMAENVPTLDTMAEAITQEALARLAAAAPAGEPGQTEGAEPETPDTPRQEAHDGPEAPGGTPPLERARNPTRRPLWPPTSLNAAPSLRPRNKKG